LIVEYRLAINGLGGEKQLSMLAACERFGVSVETSPAETVIPAAELRRSSLP
jgi:hypothetical protein